MHKAKRILNLDNNVDYAIAYKAIEKNKDLFIDDSVKDIDSYLKEINSWLKSGNLGYFYYINNDLYAVIYVAFDRYRNATLNFTTFNEGNFYKTSKLIKSLVQTLFDDFQTNKVKANIFPFEHLAEAAYRNAGLKKEGIQLDEITLNGKPMSLLCLAITKRDYRKGYTPMSKQKLKELIRMIKR